MPQTFGVYRSLTNHVLLHHKKKVRYFISKLSRCIHAGFSISIHCLLIPMDSSISESRDSRLYPSSLNYLLSNKISTTSVRELGCLFQCCGSGMFIPDPRSDFFPSRIRTVSIPEPGSASKNLSISTQKKPKKWFLSSRKYVRVVHPGSGC
jgi:hypothetical protein